MTPPQAVSPPSDTPAQRLAAVPPLFPPLLLQQIGLTLQPMTLADLPEVMALEKQAYAAPWPEVAYRQELQYGERSYFEVARRNGMLIGYSGMWLLVDEAHIGTLVAHPAARGTGIGELLLAGIIHRARRLEAQTVTLEVRPSNAAARRLYARYGFAQVGRRKDYYPDHEDALLMTTPPIQSAAYRRHFQSRLQILRQRLGLPLPATTPGMLKKEYDF